MTTADSSAAAGPRQRQHGGSSGTSVKREASSGTRVARAAGGEVVCTSVDHLSARCKVNMGSSRSTSASSGGVEHQHGSGGGSGSGGDAMPTVVVPKPKRTGLATLFTHEDRGHMHKVLGAAALTHFAYRFIRMGVMGVSDDMGLHAGASTVLCIALHALLSCSSLIFRIPTRRIKEGTRIWPQFRLHSIIFTLRALACMTLVWATRRWTRVEEWALALHGLPNVAIAFAAMFAADWATAVVGERGRSLSIRQWNTSTGYRFFFAAMQFQGTAAVLVGLPRCGLYLFHVCILQVTAFLLTLRRKNLVSHTTIAAVYAVLLVLGTVVSLMDFVHTGRGDMVGSVGLLAFLLRVTCGLNKYRVWAACAAIVAACSVATQRWTAAAAAGDADAAASLEALAAAWKAVQLPLYVLVFCVAWPKYKARRAANVKLQVDSSTGANADGSSSGGNDSKHEKAT